MVTSCFGILKIKSALKVVLEGLCSQGRSTQILAEVEQESTKRTKGEQPKALPLDKAEQPQIRAPTRKAR